MPCSTTIDETPFFALVRTHTIQGTFCDPAYGGNANFVGWDLIGYPGVRLNVTAADQRMAQTPNRFADPRTTTPCLRQVAACPLT